VCVNSRHAGVRATGEADLKAAILRVFLFSLYARIPALEMALCNKKAVSVRAPPVRLSQAIFALLRRQALPSSDRGAVIGV
jgi:hypothetical protein